MSIVRYLAAPLAPIYGMVVARRNRRFDLHPDLAQRAGVPVISLGNLSTGGTGKTPVSLFLATNLEAEGFPTAILSRGHGGQRSVDPMAVVPGANPTESGDEPALMAERLGKFRVFVGRKRIEAARLARTQRPELQVLLLDDGFQHRALYRDLDLLLLDGLRLWGNGRLLPLGDLREPASSARRAQALIVTRAGRVADREAVEEWWKQNGSGGPIFWLDFRLASLRTLDGVSTPLPEETPVPSYAWCGLGNPEAFFADLRSVGVSMRETARFADHHGPSPDELEAMDAEAIHVGAKRLICTEKDAVKLTEEHLSRLSIPLLIAEQRVEGGAGLLGFVEGKLHALMAPKK